MLQKAMCISTYEPMSDLIKVGDYCEIDINNQYVDDDDVIYVEVYKPQKIGDMPLKHFSLVNETSTTLLKGSVIDFGELSRRYSKHTKIVFEPIINEPSRKYDVRHLTNERVNEILSATNLK